MASRSRLRRRGRRFRLQGLIATPAPPRLAFYTLLGVFLHRQYPPWAGVARLHRGRSGGARAAGPATDVQSGAVRSHFRPCVAGCSMTISPALSRFRSPGSGPSLARSVDPACPPSVLLAGAIRLLEADRRLATVRGRGGLPRSRQPLTPVGYELLLCTVLIRSSTSEISEWQAHHALPLRSPGVLPGCLLMLRGGLEPLCECGSSDPGTSVFALVIAGVRADGIPERCHRERALDTARGRSTHLRAAMGAHVGPAPSFDPVSRATLAAVVALGMLYAAQPPTPEQLPARIAQSSRGSRHTDLRVLSPYNLSGYLREFGGDRVRLAIDGRADRYGDARIRRHNDLMSARGDWEAEISRLRPDVVVVDRTSPLRDLLLLDGWRQDIRDGDFVLLVRG